jgi:hypothetical protein
MTLKRQAVLFRTSHHSATLELDSPAGASPSSSSAGLNSSKPRM